MSIDDMLKTDLTPLATTLFITMILFGIWFLIFCKRNKYNSDAEKKFKNLNPTAFFMLIAFLVFLCVLLAPIIAKDVEDSKTPPSLVEGKICSMCGKKATHYAGKFYCEDCLDKEYKDAPLYNSHSS